MKNVITLFIFFIVGNVNAQIINFTDANFKDKLIALGVDTNLDNNIQESEALAITILNLSNSNISILEGIQHFTNLEILSANYNTISTIDISQLTNLFSFECINNNLISINIGNLPQLFVLRINSNNLSNIDLSGLPNLQSIYAGNNQLNSIDVSNNFFFQWGDFINNNLQYVILKNGNFDNYALDSYNYQNNPNLQFICVNDNFVTDVQTIINTTVGVPSNVVVSSYCSFTPGGIFYTIQGTTKYDQANDGCDASDTNFANLKLNVTDGSNSGSVIANSSGNYILPVSAGTHTLTPVLENPSYFIISPNPTSVTFPATASPFIQNFCISPNGIHNDLAVELIPLTKAKPGFDSQYKINFRNKGTQTQSGSVNFSFQDAVLDVVSTNPSPTTTVLNSLTWSLSNLQPFENREITIILNVNSPLETPAVNSGDLLSFSATIVGLTDETPTDNTVVVNQTVQNSFDPNDKNCLEGSTISPSKIGDYVHYMIRFENSGTDIAQNVVIKDIIDDTKFEISTLQFVDSSHSCITKISNGNRVEFIFEEINLPFNDANNDGYIVFKIKSKNTLIIGDQITNNANIYFDYNAPIATNIATSTYQALNNIDFSFGDYFTLSPVPAKDFLNITSKQQVEIKSISVYNMLGQLVQTFINPSNTIDVSILKSGSYILKITSKDVIINTKFSKN